MACCLANGKGNSNGNGNGNKICVTGVNNAPTTQLATASTDFAACHTQSPTHAICNAQTKKEKDLLAVHKIWRASCNACHNLIPTRTSGSLSLHLPHATATAIYVASCIYKYILKYISILVLSINMQSACFQIVANVQVLYMSAPATTTTTTTLQNLWQQQTRQLQMWLYIWKFISVASSVEFNLCARLISCVWHDMPAERLQMD